MLQTRKHSANTKAKDETLLKLAMGVLLAITSLSRAEDCTSLMLLQQIHNPTPSANDMFGHSVAISGNLVVVGETGDGIATVSNAITGDFVATLYNPTPYSYDEFGASVGISGNMAVVGSPHDATVSGDEGTASVFVATTGVRTTTLASPEQAPGDKFGAAVAISGNLVVVGAPGSDPNNVASAGAAYVFNTSIGPPVATLINPSPSVGDEFGISVSISGNLVVVGAPGDNQVGVSSGSAYVFNATTGALVSTLVNPTPEGLDHFGDSVSISGELAVVRERANVGAPYDGSDAYVFNATTGAVIATLSVPFPDIPVSFGPFAIGISDNVVALGAYGLDAMSQLVGKVYAYNAMTGAMMTILRNPTLQVNDSFGNSVAISGNKVIAGAENEDYAAANSGMAYTFACTDSCIPDTANKDYANPDLESGSHYGVSIGVAGDFMVVGARRDDSSGISNAGRCYIHVLGSSYIYQFGGGSIVAALDNPSAGVDDLFGNSVAISSNHALVGAVGDNPAGIADAGEAYLYDLSYALPMKVLTNPAPSAGDSFGASVGVSDSVAVIGTPADDPDGVNDAGTVYLFDSVTGALTATLNNPVPAAGDQFGFAVATDGILAVVGAPFDNPSGVADAGTAYVFNATSGTLTRTLANPAPATGDQFGGSIAISGNYIVVGAPFDSPSGVTNAGRAYVFNATTGALVSTLVNPAPTMFDFFGNSVAIHGDVAMVGAWRDDPGAIADAGRTYTFVATTGVLATTLSNPSPTASDFFGASVAISETTAIAGAYLDDPGGIADAGTVYTFTCLPPNAAHGWEYYE